MFEYHDIEIKKLIILNELPLNELILTYFSLSKNYLTPLELSFELVLLI
jgi:hypothetical protein